MSILLFDGVCNLCNGLVRFVIRRDGPARFSFAALQSPVTRGLLERCGMHPEGLETFVLIEDERCFTRSTAALRLLWGLGWPWRLAYALVVIPAGLRDRVYDAIARRRYRWFGRREACMVPTQELQARFLTEPEAGPGSR